MVEHIRTLDAFGDPMCDPCLMTWPCPSAVERARTTELDALRAERDAAVQRSNAAELMAATAESQRQWWRDTAVEKASSANELRATLAATRERGQALAESIRSMLDKYTDYPTTRLGFLLVLNEWDAAEAQDHFVDANKMVGTEDQRLTIFERIMAWQRETFSHASPASVMAHLAKEIIELSESPTDAGEIADCFLLLTGLSSLAGVDPFEAMESKLAINKARRWGTPDADGVVEHVRDEAQGGADAGGQAADVEGQPPH